MKGGTSALRAKVMPGPGPACTLVRSTPRVRRSALSVLILALPPTRALHSSAFPLNFSTFCGTRQHFVRDTLGGFSLL